MVTRATKEHCVEAGHANAGALVAIVEAHPFLRECIRRGVQSALPLPVVTFSGLSELGMVHQNTSFLLVVLSLIGASPSAYANALRELSQFASSSLVIVLAPTNDSALARAVIRCGAKGFIPVVMGFEIAVEAIRFVLAGGTYVPPECLLSPDQSSLPEPEVDPLFNTLTTCELSVARAIQQGKSNNIIALELNISLSSVKVHVRTLMRKMRAKNRTQVAMRG